MPHWPAGVNLRGLARTAAVGLMNARRRSLVIDGGSDWPEYFWSAGLGSNRSIWLGAPSMKRKMTFFAFGAKCGGLGARGSAMVAARPSWDKRFARAIVSIPPAQERKKDLRVWIFRYSLIFNVDNPLTLL